MNILYILLLNYIQQIEMFIGLGHMYLSQFFQYWENKQIHNPGGVNRSITHCFISMA